MKFVRLRVEFPPAARLPVQAALVDCDAFERADVRFGGISTDGPRSYVVEVTGDPPALATALGDHDGIIECELVHAEGDHGVVYAHARSTETELAMQATLSAGSLVTMPPIAVHPDGSVVFRVVGEQDDLGRAVEAVSADLPATVERLGDYDGPPERVGAALTERQAELVRTGLELGYYDVPRTATHEDVADAADCAPSTASEHLRKAETAVLRATFE
jgi:predicted DNA binding protein